MASDEAYELALRRVPEYFQATLARQVIEAQKAQARAKRTPDAWEAEVVDPDSLDVQGNALVSSNHSPLVWFRREPHKPLIVALSTGNLRMSSDRLERLEKKVRAATVGGITVSERRSGRGDRITSFKGVYKLPD